MNQAIDIQFLLEKSIILTSGSVTDGISWNLKWNDDSGIDHWGRLAVAVHGRYHWQIEYWQW